MNEAIRATLAAEMTKAGWIGAEQFVSTCAPDELAELVRLFASSEKESGE